MLVNKKRDQNKPVIPKEDIEGPTLASETMSSGTFLENLQSLLLEIMVPLLNKWLSTA